MSKWISVKERLPEPEQYVLVCTPELAGQILDDDKFVTMAYYYDEGDFVDPERDDDDIHGITHWMPLPEPPKEEE